MKPLVSIFLYLTREGIEKLEMAQRRRSLRRGTALKKAEKEIASVKLHTQIDLNRDTLFNRRLNGEFSQPVKSRFN